MSSHNDVFIFHGGRKHKFTKVEHPLQAVRIDGLVSHMQTHIHLTAKQPGVITYGTPLLHPGRVYG